MPWNTGAEFAERHNHKLTGSAANTAARMATGMVNAGMDEGKAIRIANAHGDKMMHEHRESGGATLGTHDNPLIQEGPEGAPVGARPVPGSRDRNRFWNDNDIAPYNPPGTPDDRKQGAMIGGHVRRAFGGIGMVHGDPLGKLAILSHCR